MTGRFKAVLAFANCKYEAYRGCGKEYFYSEEIAVCSGVGAGGSDRSIFKPAPLHEGS